MTTRLNDSAISTTGNIVGNIVTANVVRTDNYQYANGAPFAGGGSSYGNSNVVALLAEFGSNTVSTTGNITGGYILGNGSQLTGLPAGYGNANVDAHLAGTAGNIIPVGNNAQSLGNATNQWNDLYVSNTTIFMNNVPISVGAGNVLTVNGNAVLQNDSNTSITTTGNVTANYFFGNGSQLSGISTASISNGTSNVAIPTANGNVSITANAASTWTFSTDSTLTLPAGSSRITSYGQITIETDNNASGMYLNADGVNLLYANANVTLRANSTGTNKDWNFGNTGVLTLPNADATGFGNIYFEENSSTITFGLDDNATPYLYSFSTSGITLPKGGVVSEGAAPTGIGNTIAITPSGGSDANQQLLVYPTGNIVVGNHLHLTTGNLYNTELFLGNDNLYVKLANTGNVVINSYDGVGNAGQWTFGTNGNLTLPGNIIAINYADGNRVTGGITFSGEAVIGTGTSNTQSGLYLTPDPVSLANDLYLRVRGNILDEPTHIHFDTGNNQYYNQYIGDDNKYILLANTGNVVINSNDAAGNSAQWNFGVDGTLTLPRGGATIQDTVGNAVAFGYQAGFISQGNSAVAIGYLAGYDSQSSDAVAIGPDAGKTSQGFNAVAVGFGAGANSQGSGAVSVGVGAGFINQGDSTVAIGATAGYQAQAVYAVAIGLEAGQTSQAQDAIAIGRDAGKTSQGEIAVAIGHLAGNASQGNAAVAMGAGAGTNTQGLHAVAIGTDAGATTQGNRAVAIGYLAGSIAQGTAAVAIGYYAGELNQGNNSIIINATDTSLQQTTANTFTVKPVRAVANVTFAAPTAGSVPAGFAPM